ncbi:hypothetical protein AALO_G00296030 [Alosa alosa]|uniref:Gastrin/cholecystokinin type B receptor n=1 Tax=Alosa alosa TaxID=278164 RepID=A0AAV6FDA3_9TELE|nr:hypothetical protein AALO_G00296030 [Alosa alosa]
METFTTHDMLINTTDIYKILCGLGIGNVSECEPDAPPEPKDMNQAVRIALYSIIFLLSIFGNSLIIAVLVRNRRMRTVTNLFLLSLAASDLMLCLFCMPFTLIPNLMKDFVFGSAICKGAMYFMGISVSVSTFNLVAISLERYSAICNPLTSRAWQTKSHAAKVISATWVLSLLLMLPYPISSTLVPFTRVNNSTGNMCRLMWHSDAIQQSWYVFLLLILFLLPGIVMTLAYGLISLELYRGIKFEMDNRKANRERESSTGSLKPADFDGCYFQPSKKRRSDVTHHQSAALVISSSSSSSAAAGGGVGVVVAAAAGARPSCGTGRGGRAGGGAASERTGSRRSVLTMTGGVGGRGGGGGGGTDDNGHAQSSGRGSLTRFSYTSIRGSAQA